MIIKKNKLFCELPVKPLTIIIEPMWFWNCASFIILGQIYSYFIYLCCLILTCSVIVWIITSVIAIDVWSMVFFQVNSTRRVRLCILTGEPSRPEFSLMVHRSPGVGTRNPTTCLCGRHGVKILHFYNINI